MNYWAIVFLFALGWILADQGYTFLAVLDFTILALIVVADYLSPGMTSFPSPADQPLNSPKDKEHAESEKKHSQEHGHAESDKKHSQGKAHFHDFVKKKEDGMDEGHSEKPKHSHASGGGEKHK